MCVQVMEYSAVDQDAGENGTLSYRILSSFPEEHFIINCERKTLYCSLYTL